MERILAQIWVAAIREKITVALQSAGWNQSISLSVEYQVFRMTLGSKLPAFSASRQLTSDNAAAEGRRGDVASKHYSGVRP